MRRSKNMLNKNEDYSSNLFSWYLHINNYIFKPLRWQKPLFKIIQYALTGRCSNVMVSVPPQHGKTVLLSEAFASYFMVNNPDESVILTAYSQQRATKYGLRIRDIINRYSNFTMFKPKLSQDQQSKSDFELGYPYKGRLLAAGAHGAIMGNPANLIIIDDPIKELKDAGSPTMQDNLEEWYTGSINSRLRKRSDGKPPIVIILAQRLNVRDLQGILMEKGLYIDGKEALQRLDNGETIEHKRWVNLNFPAICDDEDEDLIGRKVGEPLWPEHKNINDLKYDRELMGNYRFNTIMQGKPVKLEGAIFHRANFYNEDGTLNCLVPEGLVYPFLPKVRCWDLAARFRAVDLDGADEVSGVLTSYDPKTDCLYVYDLVNGKYTASNLLRTIKSTIKEDGYDIITNIEQEGGSQSVLFITQLSELLSNYSIIHHKPTGDKAYRTLELQRYCDFNKIKFVVNENTNKNWIYKTVEQLISFDGGESNAKLKKHDDIVDSLSASANYWLLRRGRPEV